MSCMPDNIKRIRKSEGDEMNQKAAERYGLEQRGDRHITWTKQAIERMIKDYPALLTCARDLDITPQSLRIQARMFGLSWPKSYVCSRFRVPGTVQELKWELPIKSKEAAEKKYQKYTGKLTVISCPHNPFVDEGYVEEMLRREKGELGHLCINGDIVTFDSFSRWGAEYSITPVQELKTALEFLKSLNPYCTGKTLITANHDLRLYKYLKRMLTLNDIETLDFLGAMEPIEYLGKFGNADGIRTYWALFGDILICHPESYWAGGGTAKTFSIYFRNIGLEGKFSRLVCGHTHKVNSDVFGPVRVFETGAMTRLPDYATRGKITKSNPDTMQAGYYTCWLKNGKYVPGSENLQYLGRLR